MSRRYRLTENRLRGIVRKAVKGVLCETRLDYDEDNFSGRHSRGTRYDICSDGNCIYHDVPEEVVDRLADDVERRYGNVDVQCISGDECDGYVDPEGYLDDPNDKNRIEFDMWENGADFPSLQDAENDYSWSLFDRKGIAPGMFGDYNVGRGGLDKEIDNILAAHARGGQWSDLELRHGRRNMDRWVQGRRSPEDIGDNWEDLHY